jgi:glycosyltransferase involved in cell wall biosynthesis
MALPGAYGRFFPKATSRESLNELMVYPSVSVVIPTLNAAATLDECLDSIVGQDYPAGKVEIIIVDGGSNDDSVPISRKFGARIFPNPLKTSEAGKAVGILKAVNDIILLVDSDNILENKTWLKQMTRPFLDQEITAAEPVRFAWRSHDSPVDRYCALMGMNDPICLFTGIYDKWNYITNTWTGVPIRLHPAQGFIKFTAASRKFMTMGANGCLIRRNHALPYAKSKYYFDVDVTYDLAVNKHAFFAKVDCGIIHHYAKTLQVFKKKQTRRIKDYLFFNEKGKRNTGVSQKDIVGLLMFVLYTVTIIPVSVQALIGYIRKPDRAWVLHPVCCLLTLSVYGFVLTQSVLSKNEIMDRTNW